MRRDHLCTAHALVAMALITGCVEDGAVPSDPAGLHGGWVQSETSMARARIGGDAERIIVAYNDAYEIHDGAPPGSQVYRPDFSFHGLSVSDDQGITWERRGQLSPSLSSSIQAMRGDPWVAAAESLVLYVGMTALASDGSSITPSRGVMLAVSTDAADS